MTRAEALDRAIEAASLGGSLGMSPENVAARAELAQAWIAIADRLPFDAGMPPADEVKLCGHGVTAWRLGVHWVHPRDLNRCDAPPAKEGA